VNALIFYILAGAATASTALAVSRREPVHAIIYLIASFFSLSLIFYMMGAPLIAALEVIIYAGAIMVLFLFIIMMLEMGSPRPRQGPFWRVWGPAVSLSAVILGCSLSLFFTGLKDAPAPGPGFISPRAFGSALYTHHMLAVEVVSLLLLFALVGALYLGRRE